MRHLALVVVVSLAAGCVNDNMPPAPSGPTMNFFVTSVGMGDGGNLGGLIGPIVVGAGFSGHGFKFVPSVGRILAEIGLRVTVAES